jgi:hypothetical protein
MIIGQQNTSFFHEELTLDTPRENTPALLMVSLDQLIIYINSEIWSNEGLSDFGSTEPGVKDYLSHP